MPSISAETVITNLLHRYAEMVDDGDFTGVSKLFARARVYMSGPLDDAVPGESVGSVMKRFVHLYDGVPMTRHVITNTIVDISDDEVNATTRSYFTVMQIIGAPEVIVMGRYHDRFARDADARDSDMWYFTERIIMVDAVGNVAGHLVQDLSVSRDSK